MSISRFKIFIGPEHDLAHSLNNRQLNNNIFDNRFHWLNNRFLLTGTFRHPAGFGTPGLICANHIKPQAEH